MFLMLDIRLSNISKIMKDNNIIFSAIRQSIKFCTMVTLEATLQKIRGGKKVPSKPQNPL